MTTTDWLLTIAVLASGVPAGRLYSQTAPPSSSTVWQPSGAQTLVRQSSAKAPQPIPLEPGKTYTLAELIDLAQQHNPETRTAWQAAKSKAAALGIARS